MVPVTKPSLQVLLIARTGILTGMQRGGMAVSLSLASDMGDMRTPQNGSFKLQTCFICCTPHAVI